MKSIQRMEFPSRALDSLAAVHHIRVRSPGRDPASLSKAQALWKSLDLPSLKLKKPWFGYNLGVWSQEDSEDAERALRGEHYRTGELRAAQRVRLSKTNR